MPDAEEKSYSSMSLIEKDAFIERLKEQVAELQEWKDVFMNLQTNHTQSIAELQTEQKKHLIDIEALTNSEQYCLKYQYENREMISELQSKVDGMESVYEHLFQKHNDGIKKNRAALTQLIENINRYFLEDTHETEIQAIEKFCEINKELLASLGSNETVPSQEPKEQSISIEEMKCITCGTKVKDWKRVGYIDPIIEHIAECGICANKRLEEQSHGSEITNLDIPLCANCGDPLTQDISTLNQEDWYCSNKFCANYYNPSVGTTDPKATEPDPLPYIPYKGGSYPAGNIDPYIEPTPEQLKKDKIEDLIWNALEPCPDYLISPIFKKILQVIRETYMAKDEYLKLKKEYDKSIDTWEAEMEERMNWLKDKIAGQLREHIPKFLDGHEMDKFLEWYHIFIKDLERETE